MCCSTMLIIGVMSLFCWKLPPPTDTFAVYADNVIIKSNRPNVKYDYLHAFNLFKCCNTIFLSYYCLKWTQEKYLTALFYSQLEHWHLVHIQEIYNVSWIFQMSSASLYIRFRLKLSTLEAPSLKSLFKYVNPHTSIDLYHLVGTGGKHYHKNPTNLSLDSHLLRYFVEMHTNKTATTLQETNV